MRPVGDHAALLELPNNASVHIAARLARERFGDQLIEIVPGHETLLITWRAGSVMSDFSELATTAASSEKSSHDLPGPTSVTTVGVSYDGADLEYVARKLALSEAAVVELHGSATYTVGFIGSAGLPYLFHEGDEELERLTALPRRATPRTEVPAGSVAVAAGYCCIYPRASPGGWNLLGRTDAVVFDAERDPPALLEPGTRVRFEAV